MQRVYEAPEQAQAFLSEMQKLGHRERIRNLYRIKDKASGKFKFFVPNRCQEKFLDEVRGRDSVLKSRQIGFTTLACVQSYDLALFDGTTCGVMSHQKERTSKIFEIVRNAHDWFVKDWGHIFTPKTEEDSANKLTFAHNKAAVIVSYDFRSLTVQRLHSSEAAFTETARLTNSFQSVPESGSIVLETTPNGHGGWFFNQWQLGRTKGKLAPFKNHFYPWFMQYPENPAAWAEKCDFDLTEDEEELRKLYNLEMYHLAWRRWKIDESCNGDPDIFETEYPSNDIDCFFGDHILVYGKSTIKLQESYVTQPSEIGFLKTEGKRVSFFRDKKGIVDIWELPKAGGEYSIGADSSSGKGKDPSAAVVINRSNGEQVARIKAHLEPDMFGEELWKLGHFYNGAWICPELNNHGGTVISRLKLLGYLKIYRRTETNKITTKVTQELGFLTTKTSKFPLIDKHVAACREGKFKTRSMDLVNEMKVFVQMASDTGKTLVREALPECHDDELIAACLAWEMHSVRAQKKPGEREMPDVLIGARVDPLTGIYDTGTMGMEQSHGFDPLNLNVSNY